MNPADPKIKISINHEQDLDSLAKKLVAAIYKLHLTKFIIYLNGDLGVGKTTFVRKFVNAINIDGASIAVKSPTYSIVESYEIKTKIMQYIPGVDNEINTIHHFDLYRLSNQKELISIDFDFYFDDESFIFVEWPTIGVDFLPTADMDFLIDFIDKDKNDNSRIITICANTSRGINVSKYL